MICSSHPAVISWAGPRACLTCASHGPPHQCPCAHRGGQMPLLLQAVILAVGTPHIKIYSSQETFQNYAPVKWEQVRENIFAQCFANRSNTVFSFVLVETCLICFECLHSVARSDRFLYNTVNLDCPTSS